MLFQPTNIIPDTRTGIGFGVVDATQTMQVSWQINGDYPVMTAFQIVIYQNDTASTQLLDTGRLTTGCPANGRNANGEIEFFSYTIAASTLSSAGITNGNEYKFTIRQYYMDGGVETSILQSSASVFITRSAATFTMATPSVTAAESTFTWSFSQPQGDTLEWIRYQLQIVSGSITDTIYDSGSIYGASVYQFTYSGFILGQTYAIRALAQTSSGVAIETAWEQFSPSYSESTTTGAITAACMVSYNAVALDWSNASTVTGQDIWVVYRKQGNQLSMQKIGEFPVSVTAVYDFAAASGQGPYTYYLFAGKAANPSATPPTPTQYLSAALLSNAVSPQKYHWSLLDCTEQANGTYLVVKEYDFRNNLSSGSVSNNNAPNVLQNFTAMPTVQPAPQNYKSGTLTALLGNANNGKYSGDTLALREALMQLSTTQDTLFLKAGKGDVLTVHINGPISAELMDMVVGQPQSVTVPWIEIDDTPANLIAYSGGQVFA